MDIIGGMNTMSTNWRRAMIITVAIQSLSQVSAVILEEKVLHSASLQAHDRKMA